MLLPDLLEITPGKYNHPVRLPLLERCGRHHWNAIAGAVLAKLPGVVVEQIIQQAEAKFVDHGRGPDRRAVAGNGPAFVPEIPDRFLQFASERIEPAPAGGQDVRTMNAFLPLDRYSLRHRRIDRPRTSGALRR